MVLPNSTYINIKSPHSLNVQAWLKEGLIFQTDKGIFIGEGAMVLSNRLGRGFFHPDFFLEKKHPWVFPKKVFFTTRAFIENRLDDAVANNPLSLDMKKAMSLTSRREYSSQSQNREQPSFTEFHTVFAQLQQKIKQGALKKGVPVFFEKIYPSCLKISDTRHPREGGGPAIQSENSNTIGIKGKACVLKLLKTLFQKTAAISHEGFLYGAWNENGGVLGFTPETLFSFSERNISLMALAGTAPWPGPSLFHDPKEMQEHEWVIQSLKEALGQTVNWNSSHTTEKKFGSLKHLCTNMEGALKQSADFNLLCQKLHPTAALGGFPKQAAFNWLRENPQQKDRGHFGAPFGFFDGKDKGFCLITLRGIEWDSQGFRIGAGCGLVKNSILQKEWRELTLKRNQIKQFFA